MCNLDVNSILKKKKNLVYTLKIQYKMCEDRKNTDLINSPAKKSLAYHESKSHEISN